MLASFKEGNFSSVSVFHKGIWQCRHKTKILYFFLDGDEEHPVQMDAVASPEPPRQGTAGNACTSQT